MKRIITIEAVKEAVEAAHAHFLRGEERQKRRLHPLSEKRALRPFRHLVCLADGRSVTVGDTDYRFGIESVSKVPTAILAMNQYSAKKVLSQIGADATGLPFNSIMAILLENDHPSTPLVNAGAISACSMIKPTGNAEAKWKAIVDFISGLCGSKVSVLDELYRSESETNFNNRSIAWLLKSYNRIYDDPDMSLDLYTRQWLAGHHRQTARRHGRHDRQLRHQSGDVEGGFHPNLTHTSLRSWPPSASTSIRATGSSTRPSGQDRRGRRHHGVVPGVMGVAAFAPPLDDAGQLGQGPCLP